MPTPVHYPPPIKPVGHVRFRPSGPALPAYEASTPAGPVLLYWSPLVQDFIPIHEPQRVQLEGARA